MYFLNLKFLIYIHLILTKLNLILSIQFKIMNKLILYYSKIGNFLY